jgi:Tfp pilus assembly protein FimT
MAVVAIVGVLAAIGGLAIGRSNRAVKSSALARSLHLALLEARSEAVSDGFQRRFLCASSTSCAIYIATTRGMGTATWSATAISKVSGNNDAVVWAYDPQTDNTSVTPAPGPLAGTAEIIFFPDGSASGTAGAVTGATLFVSNSTGKSPYKIFVYPATGLSRLVDSW